MSKNNFCALACRRVFEYDMRALSVQGGHTNGHSFDEFLEMLWDRASESGMFRYRLNLETKILPGKYNFVAQLNPDRALKRRKPQFISDVSQPFNPDIFNFRNVNPEEILFELRPLHWKLNESHEFDKKPPPINLVIVNVSPLEHCNSLLVPDVYSCHPQVIYHDSLKLAIEMMLLSHSKDLRIGFNSLGAYASVNHQHFHMYYLKQRLYLENARVRCLAGDCHEIIDFPSCGFAFQIVDEVTDASMLKVISNVMKLLSTFLEKKIAHNLFITRGSAFECCNDNHNTTIGNYDAVRIFLFARNFSHGAKDDMGFNPALCELAGHLPIKTKDFYDEISEDAVEEILKSVCYSTFMSIREDVKQLFAS